MRPATSSTTRCMAAAALFGLGLLVSPAFAQGAGAPPPPGTGGDLGGPGVPPGAGEGEGQFGGQGKPGRRGQGGPGGPGEMRGRMMEGAIWMRTLEGMKESIDPETWGKIDKIRNDFKSEMTKWQETNGKRARELMEQMRQARENGGQPDKALLDEMQKLNQGRPNMEANQKQMFALLSPEQQDAFKRKLAENEAKMKDRRGNREGGPGEGGPGKGGKRGPGGKGGKGGDGPPPPPRDGDGNPPPPPMDE